MISTESSSTWGTGKFRFLLVFLNVSIFLFAHQNILIDIYSGHKTKENKLNFCNDIECDQGGNVTLDDIFISVKTSKHTEKTRLPVILKTWFQLAKQQTWFFTDSINPELQKLTNGHMINTKCPSWHNRIGLNCKMGMEYNYFMNSGKKWFCHFDDDNYVNVPRLLKMLQSLDYRKDWYLGKRSTLKRIRVGSLYVKFGTGGAGICISKALANKMYSIAGRDGFKEFCLIFSAADDVCIGYIIRRVTKGTIVRLTHVRGFHSHFEQMNKISLRNLPMQITFSYSHKNIVGVPGFNITYDPTRFLSLHCFLFPNVESCKGYTIKRKYFRHKR